MMRRKFAKVISLFMSIVLMLSLCGCNIAKDIKDDIQNRIDITNSAISSQEIVRHIIDAINDENMLADSYSSIPENQRDGVTYSMYFEYVNILRHIANQNGGKISYFRMLSSSEVRSSVGEDLYLEYSGLIGAELQFSDKSGNIIEVEDPLYIYFVDSEEMATLSSSWISGIIDIYNYGDHYFTMIDDQSSDGVFTLLDPGFAADDYSLDVIRAMSDSLIDFYRVDVKSSRDDYRVSHLTPDEYTIRVPEVITTGEEYTEHFVYISRSSGVSGDIYHIYDIIPFAINEDMLYVMYSSNGNDLRLLKVGSNYSRNTIVFNLGDPRYEFSRNDDVTFEEDSEGNVLVYRRTVAIYPDLTLIFNTSIQEDGWEGELRTISITGDSYFIGDNVTVGMTRNELLIKYPFMNEFGYQHLYTDVTGMYEVSFIFDDNDVLTEIKLEKLILEE